VQLDVFHITDRGLSELHEHIDRRLPRARDRRHRHVIGRGWSFDDGQALPELLGLMVGGRRESTLPFDAPQSYRRASNARRASSSRR